MIALVLEHLWQSTLFAGCALLLTLVLSGNRAKVRYLVWFAASVKFLIPFALLVGIGAQVLRQPGSRTTQAEWVVVADRINRPLTAPAGFTPAQEVPASTAANNIPAVLLAAWGCGFVAVAVYWSVRWRAVRSLRRSAVPLLFGDRQPDVSILSASGLLEPGVFGLVRPTLLLPEGIVDRLSPEQLNAIIDHELCHLRRRDNWTAAIHMAVETIFWFHPLVWWLGSRLVDERERACDEEVLRRGGDPNVYAEGILNVCKFYVESPLPCVPGVTGSDLKKRIEAIMRNRSALRLSFAKKAALATAAAAALTVPILVGMQAALRFEVASIKPAATWDPKVTFPSPGRLHLGGESLAGMIRYAYDAGVGSNKEVTGGPDWVNRDLYSVEATAEGSPTVAEYQAMLRNLLEERFALKIRRNPTTVDVYALVMANPNGKLGPKVEPFAGECGDMTAPSSASGKQIVTPQTTGALPYAPDTDPTVPPLGCRVFFGGTRGITLEGAPMAFLARMLSTLTAILGRPVVDRTGLTGRYNIRMDLEFPPRPRPNEPDQADVFAPLLFDALKNHLGLRLEPSKGTVENIVIDGAERPTTN